MKGKFTIWTTGSMIMWVFAIVVLYLVFQKEIIAVFDCIARWNW